MERILVGIDLTHPVWEALVRALCLAPRIQARVAVLAVFAPGTADSPEAGEVLREVRERIGAANEAGAFAELFVAEGLYDQEVIETARQLKTTLLVAPSLSEGQGGEREAEILGRILQGVECRVELVSPKKNPKRTKDGL